MVNADYDAIAAGQLAAQSGIQELLAAHEAKVITRMVNEYRTGTLSPEEAKAGVAVISELRLLASSTERAIERGRQAGRKLTA